MRRKTTLYFGAITALALTMLVASVAYAAPIKKLYRFNINPANPPVTVGTDAETFNATIQNMTATQSLGSCNVTLPASLTSISATNPTTGGGTATVVGNVIQLRNLNTPPMGSRSFTFSAAHPSPGTYTATIDCRQANNYSPSTPSNAFTLDTANSTLSWTASNPIPNADLSIVTSEETPDPVVGGNTVKYILTVTNNGPSNSGASVSVTNTVSGSGSLTSISGSGWSCTGSGNTRTCTSGIIGNGSSLTLDVRVLANVVSSASSVTNSASVLQSGESNDPNSGNNATSATTTVNPGSSSGSGYIDNVTGGVVISEPFATAFNQSIARVEFPGQIGGTPGGFIYNISKTTESCALLPCTYAWLLDDVPEQYDDPVDEEVHGTFTCDSTVCPGNGTAITMFWRDETGNQQIVLPCNFLGIADPAPCQESSQRLSGGQAAGDLAVTILFLAGDPKVAGLCLGTC